MVEYVEELARGPGHPPEAGHRGLRGDWARTVPPGDYVACNSMRKFEDFTAENEPARVVSGWRRWGKRPVEELVDSVEAHPDEILVTSRVGSVVVSNAHLRHGGCNNNSVRERYVVQGLFAGRDGTPQTVQSDYLRPQTAGRHSPDALHLLDVAGGKDA